MVYMITRIHEYQDILRFCCKGYEKKKKSVINLQILAAVVTQLMVVIWVVYACQNMPTKSLILSAYGSHTPVSRW